MEDLICNSDLLEVLLAAVGVVGIHNARHVPEILLLIHIIEKL